MSYKLQLQDGNYSCIFDDETEEKTPNTENVWTKKNTGNFLLKGAISGDHGCILKLLLNPSKSSIDRFGFSPLHYAAKFNYPDILKLCSHVNVRSKLNRTPLHLAAYYGSTECVKVLLSLRATIDLTDVLHMTALHWAVYNGFIEIVNILLSANANPHLCNKYGKSASDLALMAGHESIYKLLRYYTAENQRTRTINITVPFEKSSIISSNMNSRFGHSDTSRSREITFPSSNQTSEADELALKLTSHNTLKEFAMKPRNIIKHVRDNDTNNHNVGGINVNNKQSMTKQNITEESNWNDATQIHYEKDKLKINEILDKVDHSGKFSDLQSKFEVDNQNFNDIVDDIRNHNSLDNDFENLTVAKGNSNQNNLPQFLLNKRKRQHGNFEEPCRSGVAGKRVKTEINFNRNDEKMKDKIFGKVDQKTDPKMLKLLEEHGIKELPVDESPLVTSAIKSGQKVVLTEAGKLALKQTERDVIREYIIAQDNFLQESKRRSRSRDMRKRENVIKKSRTNIVEENGTSEDFLIEVKKKLANAKEEIFLSTRPESGKTNDKITLNQLNQFGQKSIKIDNSSANSVMTERIADVKKPKSDSILKHIGINDCIGKQIYSAVVQNISSPCVRENTVTDLVTTDDLNDEIRCELSTVDSCNFENNLSSSTLYDADRRNINNDLDSILNGHETNFTVSNEINAKSGADKFFDDKDNNTLPNINDSISPARNFIPAPNETDFTIPSPSTTVVQNGLYIDENFLSNVLNDVIVDRDNNSIVADNSNNNNNIDTFLQQFLNLEKSNTQIPKKYVISNKPIETTLISNESKISACGRSSSIIISNSNLDHDLTCSSSRINNAEDRKTLVISNNAKISVPSADSGPVVVSERKSFDSSLRCYADRIFNNEPDQKGINMLNNNRNVVSVASTFDVTLNDDFNDYRKMLKIDNIVTDNIPNNNEYVESEIVYEHLLNNVSEVLDSGCKNKNYDDINPNVNKIVACSSSSSESIQQPELVSGLSEAKIMNDDISSNFESVDCSEISATFGIRTVNDVTSKYDDKNNENFKDIDSDNNDSYGRYLKESLSNSKSSINFTNNVDGEKKSVVYEQYNDEAINHSNIVFSDNINTTADDDTNDDDKNKGNIENKGNSNNTNNNNNSKQRHNSLIVTNLDDDDDGDHDVEIVYEEWPTSIASCLRPIGKTIPLRRGSKGSNNNPIIIRIRPTGKHLKRIL